MRITIVQTEIEQAIRDSILRQISVNEGMRIDITLRATRGAEGYQADIDIRPETDEVEDEPVVETEPEPTPVTKPLGIEETVTAAKATGRRTRAKATAPAEPNVAEEATNENQDQVSVEVPDEPTAVVEADTSGSGNEPEAETPKVSSLFARKDEVAAEPAPEAGPKPKSLFGDLKRPVNA